MMGINGQEVTEKQSHNDSEVVLSVNGVSKKFCRDLKQSLFYGIQDITYEVLGLQNNNSKLRSKEFWALKDVTFQLRRGEALGLVGKNGSGKSTLLRIIAGLIKPDTGFVEVTGRLAPLIALGAGFNPILTGRENIYTNMSILGLSNKEIDKRFDEVVEFAEIGDAIDAPVRSYSSGMAARLGFSCAVHTDPDILLIDEVLSVGDVRFRAKCQRKLGELRKKEVSFILVSHKAQQLMSICDKSVYLSKGQFVAFGDTNAIIHQYEEDLFGVKNQKSQGVIFLPDKPENDKIGFSLNYIRFKDVQGNNIDSLITGEAANLCLGFKANRKIENLN
ncbi:MAG: ABC transporter ATP-binding protein, partial [Scytonema sp. PMC 1069.18]|nr:ABC transporter ATP-binding protein [Scytonema sp. PMC 1069.18]